MIHCYYGTKTVLNHFLQLPQNIGRDTGVQDIPEELLQLIAKDLGDDWIAFGQQVGLDDPKLHDILDLK